MAHSRGEKTTASYLRALVYLAKGDTERAVPEVAVLQEAYQGKRTEKQLEQRQSLLHRQEATAAIRSGNRITAAAMR